MNLSKLPEHMHSGVRGYVEHGWEPGSFLYAVLCNNLVEAAAHADDINKNYLYQWASFLYNELPRSAWGDEETVRQWILNKRKENAQRQDSP